MGYISVTEAARRLGCDRATIRRWVKKKELVQTSEGIDEDSLESCKEQVLDEQDSESGKLVIQQLKEGHAQALDHAERMLSLLEKPLATMTGALTDFIEKINEREKNREESHTELMEIMGDILLRKSERESLDKQAAAKSQMMAAAGMTAMKHIPTLIEQMAGKNMTLEFLRSLNEEERVGMWQLVEAFDDPVKRTMLEKVLLSAGIPKPKRVEETGESAGD